MTLNEPTIRKQRQMKKQFEGVLVVAGTRYPFTFEMQEKEIELCFDHECGECADCEEYMDDICDRDVQHICYNPKNKKDRK